MRYQVRPEPIELEFVDAVQWFPNTGGHPLVAPFVEEGKIRGQLKGTAGIAFIDAGDWIIIEEGKYGRVYPWSGEHFHEHFILA